jgi:hypothetical protein
VNQLIAKKPNDRVQSASEVVQALAPFCERADLNTLVRQTDSASTVPGATPTERLQGGSTDAATNPPSVQASPNPTNTTRQSALQKPLIGLGCLAAVAALAFLVGRLDGDANSEPEQGQEVVATADPETPPVVATEPPSASEPVAATPPSADTTTAADPGATAEYEEAVKRAFQNGVVQVNFQDRNVWSRSSNADEFLKCNQPTADGTLPPALVEIDPAVATAPMALVELKRMCRIHTVKIKGQAPLSDAMIRSIDVPGLAELISYALITNRQLTKLPVAPELTALRMRGPVEINAHEQRVDAVLEHFPNLQELEINAKGMSLDTFNLLQPLNLTRLSLYEPSKEALAALSEFKSIKTLDIRTDSKEETQDWFGKLPGKLEGLYIHGFFLTVGEKELKAMRRYRLLQVLQLNCDYSADGLEAFRAANPNCIVYLRRQP